MEAQGELLEKVHYPLCHTVSCSLKACNSNYTEYLITISQEDHTVLPVLRFSGLEINAKL
jgi:hypothetical protein